MSGGPADDSGRSPLVAPSGWRRVAHDLRSPLGLVSGALEELEHDLSGRPTDRSERLMALAGRGVANLARIAALLTLAAEVEAGELVADREPGELRPLLEAALERSDRLDPRAELAVRASIPSGLIVRVDVEHVLGALVELILDARRRADAEMDVTAEAAGAAVLVTVRAISVRARGAGVDEAPPEDRAPPYGLVVARDLLAANGGTLTALDDGHRLAFEAASAD